MGPPERGSEERVLFLPFTGQSLPVRGIPGNLSFYGHPSDADYTGMELQVTASWMPESAPGTHWTQLVAAFDAYSQRRFDEAVIPANVAVEATLRELIRPTLERFVSNTKLQGFMDVATYGHQWNVLLPTLAELHGAPRLPDHIHGLINRLRGLRNDVGHGNDVVAVSARDQAEILVAAVIAVSYLHLISTTLCPPHK